MSFPPLPVTVTDGDETNDAGVGHLPGFVGDGREKHVVVPSADGKRREYGDVFIKHATTAYAVSPDPWFPPDRTER